MDVGATISIDTLTNGTVGVEMLVYAEIIGAKAAAIAPKFIVSARPAIGAGDLVDVRIDMVVGTLIDALVDMSGGVITGVFSSIGVGILTGANRNVLGAAMTALECALPVSSEW